MQLTGRTRIMKMRNATCRGGAQTERFRLESLFCLFPILWRASAIRKTAEMLLKAQVVAETIFYGRTGGGVPPLVMQLEGNNEMNYKQNFDLS